VFGAGRNGPGKPPEGESEDWSSDEEAKKFVFGDLKSSKLAGHIGAGDILLSSLPKPVAGVSVLCLLSHRTAALEWWV
jgi:hypothetical protein